MPISHGGLPRSERKHPGQTRELLHGAGSPSSLPGATWSADSHKAVLISRTLTRSVVSERRGARALGLAVRSSYTARRSAQGAEDRIPEVRRVETAGHGGQVGTYLFDVGRPRCLIRGGHGSPGVIGQSSQLNLGAMVSTIDQSPVLDGSVNQWGDLPNGLQAQTATPMQAPASTCSC